MKSQVGRLRRDERGQSIVEMAVIVPLLLFLAFGIWEFGRVLDARVVVTNAAREGARLAAMGQTEAVIRDRVEEYLDSGLGPRLDPGGDVVIDWSTDFTVENARGAPGDMVSVTLRPRVQIYVPFLGLGSELTVAARERMRLE